MELTYYNVSQKELQIDVLLIKKAMLVLRAFNHQLRQQILRLISEKKELAVTDIYTRLGMEQPVASQHLAILRRARFVSSKRKGKKVMYSVNYDRLAEVQELLKKLLH